ncbi:MAG: DUF4384 domain-containing protein [Desulfobacteraceae bacterium]|jgi:hypothetical protein
MKTVSRVIVILTLVALALTFTVRTRPATAQERKKQDQNIRFLWAFGAIEKGEGEPKVIPVKRDMALKSGDLIKFFLKLENKCFVYVIYHSSQGEVSVLFPYRFENLIKGYQPPAQCYIPQGNEWFELDENIGQETFYLLASAKRLRGLEELINKYETADPGRKQELVKTVLTEIRRLRWENRKFKTYAERPVTTMGNLRGRKKVEAGGYPDVASEAVEISGENFYSRAFTIDHQQ